MRMPERAMLEFESGERRELVRRAYERLYLTCSGDKRGEDSGEEGGNVRKSLERVGGASEFQRSVQLKMIEQARNSWKAHLPVAMIIGDSIRMRISDGTGYVRHAYRELRGIANMVHVPHNCGGTKAGEAGMDDWLSASPDIVFYNAGLHDLARYQNSEQKPAMYRGVAEYAAGLERIFEQIRKAGVVSVLWGLNTPVHEERHRVVPRNGKPRKVIRHNRDIEEYNNVSAEVANRWGAEIVDLNRPLRTEGLERCLLADGVHLNHRGARFLGDIVAERIRNTVSS